ncbi:pyrroline-5-carboxylate reductase family protein [Nocardia sp. NPDC049526]|uniref:pyrroline-5-carboxylate reductase family protein n=1 Tax=Nocardia sp. NPDC049526 TaxID=3364316 RepID=UPI0037A4AF8D
MTDFQNASTGDTRTFATIGIVGAGNMARALATGWATPILCTDSGSGRAVELAADTGGVAVATNAELGARADVIVLCHKPGQLAAVARELDGTRAVVVSVLSGVSSAQLKAVYYRSTAVRVTVNLPVRVRAGIVSLPSGQGVDAQVESAVAELFGRVGTVVRIPEHQVGALIPLAGVGPALVAMFAQAQADAAVRAGLPAELARSLATETLRGTAALLAEFEYDTFALRRSVASPGGPTERALAAAEAHGLPRAVRAAAAAALPAQ